MIDLIICSAIFLCLGAWAGWIARERTLDSRAIPQPSAPPEPRVVVNVPADYKPLEPLTVDGKPALVGPRALLWFAAYSKAVDAFAGDEGLALSLDGEQAAFDTASAAVEQVYGDTFDT